MYLAALISQVLLCQRRFGRTEEGHCEGIVHNGATGATQTVAKLTADSLGIRVVAYI